MSTYEHRGTVDPTDIKDDFELTFDFNNSMNYSGNYEVHNHSDKGRFRFIIENETLRDEDGNLYSDPHWPNVVKRTVIPGDVDSGSFTNIKTPLYPVSDSLPRDGILLGGSTKFIIKIKWIVTTHTKPVDYHFKITSDQDFTVEK